MELISKLHKSWKNKNHFFFVSDEINLSFKDLINQKPIDISEVESGDVVSLIGDFNSSTIITFLRLIEKNVVVVPLTKETKDKHEYFFKNSYSNVIIENNKVKRFKKKSHHLLEQLKLNNRPGLILFSSGITGDPKAILHDFTFFLERFSTPRPSFIILNFLLFDHIGGINTLFHTLYNNGTIVALKKRTVHDVLSTCKKYEVEVLPTTPTFLRMLLISNIKQEKFPKSIKIITYGTEIMDQTTLNQLCKLLPNVDFRQTYGLSEIGIVRVKSENRNSLYIKIGGEGVEIKVEQNILYIKSKYQMLGYLNAPSPFDKNDWYNTNDLIHSKGEFVKIIGRSNDVINVGGLKFMAAEVEKVALEYPNIFLAKAISRKNPITGNHVEIKIQPNQGINIDKSDLDNFFKSKLPSHMIPKKVIIEKINIGHRFKRL